MQRIGQRVLAIANFAEKRAGHSLDEVARYEQVRQGATRFSAHFDSSMGARRVRS
jgi:hypothetical protein